MIELLQKLPKDVQDKITSLRGRNYGYLYIHKDDKVYVGEIDSQVTVKEAQ